MSFKKYTEYAAGSCPQSRICRYTYGPSETPSAILQISHGMCEYVERYEHFIEFMTENNSLVCGNDHLDTRAQSKILTALDSLR